MKCPHCLENFFVEWDYISFPSNRGADWIEDKSAIWGIRVCRCPSCDNIVIQLGKLEKARRNHVNSPDWYNWILARPKAISRAPLPSEIPPEFANDYKEACITIADSPKASAALTTIRQCLVKDMLVSPIQRVIAGMVKKRRLPGFLFG